MRNAIIISSGSFAPSRIIPNNYFNEKLGEDVDTWLRNNVQIYERRWCSENESTADLVEKACAIALKNADLEPGDIDLLIVATDTPEYVSPSTASVIQHRMGMKNAGTFDLNTACAGFVTALDAGCKYIKADKNYNKVMVVGAYAMSKYLNLNDKKTVTLFADGAGAVILSSSENGTGMLQSKLMTRGEYYDYMGIYAGGTHQPINKEILNGHEHQLQFVKKIPKEVNPEIWTELILELCNRENITPSDVHHYFFTQININSIRETIEKLDLEMDKAATIMHYYGYTGSACLPMAFDEWMQKDKIKPGELVMFIGSGGGLAFGAALFKM
ncbi:MAG: ketoacyl-ACP synthase III [Saprospiraceae bacterium]|nr:ketoacyl-ACP synthase III [Saprospiraceae bacterium]